MDLSKGTSEDLAADPQTDTSLAPKAIPSTPAESMAE
jgi:hypothetical protein